MSLLLDSFWRAAAYCLHPRVIALSFLPLVIMVALSLGTALGPLAASWTFDSAGSYDLFLWLAIGLMGASAALLASLPKPPGIEHAH